MTKMMYGQGVNSSINDMKKYPASRAKGQIRSTTSINYGKNSSVQKFETRLDTRSGRMEQNDSSLSVSMASDHSGLLFRDKRTNEVFVSLGGADLDLDKDNQVVLRSNHDFVLLAKKSQGGTKTEPNSGILEAVDISFHKVSDPEKSKKSRLMGTVIQGGNKQILSGASVKTKRNVGKSHNIGDLILSEQEGMQIELKSSNQQQKVKFTLGGITRSHAFSNGLSYLGASSASTKFRDLTENHNNNGISINVDGADQPIVLKFNKDNPKASEDTFNSLGTLNDCLKKYDNLLISKIENGALYIGGRDPSKAITFNNINLGGAHGKDLATALGFTNIAASVPNENRFNSLKTLADAINKNSEYLNANFVDNFGNIITGDDITKKAGELKFGVASALNSLNVSADDTTAWQKTKQVYIIRQDTDLKQKEMGKTVRVYQPNHGLVKGDFINIDAGHVAGPNVGGAVMPNISGNKFVTDSGEGWFEIDLDVALTDAQNLVIRGGDSAYPAIDTVGAPLKFRKIDGGFYTNDVDTFVGKDIAGADITLGGNIVISNDGGVVSANNTAIFDTGAAHNLIAGDLVYIKGCQAKDVGAHANFYMPDGVYAITAVNGAGNTFTVVVPHDGAIHGNLGGGGIVGVSVKALTKGAAGGVNVMDSLVVARTGNTADANNSTKVKFYTGSTSYSIDDIVRLNNNGAPIAMGGVTFAEGTEYKVENVGSDAYGRYIEISGSTVSTAANLDASLIRKNALPNLKINKVAKVLDFFGISGKKTEYTKAYDPDAKLSMSIAEIDCPNKSAYKQLQEKTVKRTIDLVDSRGTLRSLKINYVPVSVNEVVVEISAQRNPTDNKYDIDGVNEASDGVIRRGVLRFSDGKLVDKGGLDEPMNIRWMHGGEIISDNEDFEIDWDGIRLMEVDRAAWEHVEDGQIASQINGEEDVDMSEDGYLRLKYKSGKVASPFIMVLGFVNDPKELEEVGFGLYRPSPKSGEIKYKYAGFDSDSKLYGNMTKASNIDPMSITMETSEFAMQRYTMVAAESEERRKMEEIMRKITS